VKHTAKCEAASVKWLNAVMELDEARAELDEARMEWDRVKCREKLGEAAAKWSEARAGCAKCKEVNP
jgi:hypothetical protein